MQAVTETPPGWQLRVYAAILFFFGILLFIGGAWLGVLGGSVYYLLAGLTIAVAAVLLWRGDVRGAWLYALVLLTTLLWALWEVGVDGWALAPRLGAPFGFGLLLLLPWIRRDLRSE